MSVTYLKTVTHWYCPDCDVTDVTHEPRSHTRFHVCAGTRGLTIGMLPVGTKAKVEAHEREDYVGSELVQVDVNGRPVMSVTTTRDDGTDVVVYAPTATGRIGG